MKSQTIVVYGTAAGGNAINDKIKLDAIEKVVATGS